MFTAATGAAIWLHISATHAKLRNNNTKALSQSSVTRSFAFFSEGCSAAACGQSEGGVNKDLHCHRNQPIGSRVSRVSVSQKRWLVPLGKKPDCVWTRSFSSRIDLRHSQAIIVKLDQIERFKDYSVVVGHWPPTNTVWVPSQLGTQSAVNKKGLSAPVWGTLCPWVGM